tara:strand:- start:1 stop:978 length:978 start_codon:yes stop_codon:yes gene_type:complete
MKKYYLSVLAIFKNETYVLKEWIDHYISEGVEHFYMIDNNSNDNPDTILKPYIDDGMVDLFHERRKQRFIQLPAYNRLFPKLKVESEWLLVIDLDEIMYARNGYNTIIDFIRENDNKFDQILVPWKNFGSSGWVNQPENLINSFLFREDYSNGAKVKGKYIVRMRKALYLNVHCASLIKGSISIDCMLNNSHIAENTDYFPHTIWRKMWGRINNSFLENSYLHINHYKVQSSEWFINVKLARGRVGKSRVKNIKFSEGDTNEVIDLEVYKKYNKGEDISDKEILVKKQVKTYLKENERKRKEEKRLRRGGKKKEGGNEQTEVINE